MLFFKVEAEIKGKKFQDSSEWMKFKECAADHSEELFELYENNIFIFTTGPSSKNKITFGIMSRIEIDVISRLNNFLALIDAEFYNIVIFETTMRIIYLLLKKSDKNDLIKDDNDVLRTFGIDEIVGYYGGAVSFEERMINEALDKKILLNATNTILCNETLVPEIERIYQKQVTKKIKGHPVHYVVQTDDIGVKNHIIGILLTALYTNKRIFSKRSCNISFETDERIPSQYDALYYSCYGGAVSVSYGGSDDDNERAYVNTRPNVENVRLLCDSVKKHKNDVVSIICLPRNCENIKAAFIEHLGATSLIFITEDVVFGENAKNYLRHLAKENNITPDKTLYSIIDDPERGFHSVELSHLFDTWHSKKLKTYAYPQYAGFDSANSNAVAKKPKGSAFTELEEMIGLSEAKTIINQAVDFHKAQKLYKEKGVSTDRPAMHMVFSGNPGTAKTTVARLFAQIMKDNGLLSEGDLYEVGRADLVGKYVGWTAQIVKKKFAIAKGSVLFIDEAYSLVDDRDGLYGDEAINTIVQEMENNREDMVVIFAGYPDKMEQFMRKNPGLKSRIAFHVPFKDYSPEELFQITQLMAKNKKINLDDDVEEKLLSIYKTCIEHENFGNGRFARNIIEKAQMKQASRLVAKDPAKVSLNEVLTLIANDFEISPPISTVERKVIGFY